MRIGEKLVDLVGPEITVLEASRGGVFLLKQRVDAFVVRPLDHAIQGITTVNR